MGMADLDLDGDLDIVVNNLRAPAQLFENSLCGGQALEVDLRWPGSRNVFAVGARLELDVDGQTLVRHVHAASGYLFGDAPRVHFGLDCAGAVAVLRVQWRDGAQSVFPGPPPGALLTVTRTAEETP